MGGLVCPFAEGHVKKRDHAAVPSAAPTPAPRSLIERYAAGWDRGQIVRMEETMVYSGEPRLDVYAEEWLVCAMNDDIRILHQRDWHWKLHCPWQSTAGNANSIRRSSARTTDDMRCSGREERVHKTPRALSRSLPTCDAGRCPSASSSKHHSRRSATRTPRWSRLNALTTLSASKGGYLMLLAQGFTRFSKDLTKLGSTAEGVATGSLSKPPAQGA